MLAPWLWLVTSAAAPSPVLDAGERESLALVNEDAEIVAQVDELLRQHTDLVLFQLGLEAIEDCRGSPICIALRARAHIGERRASYLAMITYASERLSAVLIDLEEARRCADSGDEVLMADCAAERAVVATSSAREVENDEARRRQVERLVREVFRPALERSGHWEPYGSIEVNVDRPGTTVSLDGKLLGTVDRASRIESVRPGTRTLAFEHPNALREEVTLELRRGELESVTVKLVSNTPAHPARAITLWSGVGLAAVGVGISIWAAAAGASAPVAGYCTECGGSRFATFSQLAGGEEEHFGAPRGGVLALPLGYSLAGAGAMFSLGALFLGADEELPWIAWLAGAAVGGLAYGLSALR